MKTVYVVSGSCGEYSDRTEWTVRAFLNKEKAESFKAACEAEYGRVKAKGEAEGVYRWDWDKNELDPYFTTDYTGTFYWIDEVDLDSEE